MVDEDAMGPAAKSGDMSDAAAPLPTRVEGDAGNIPHCCIKTIKQHVAFNPMMVCTECKHIIKCFKDERAYQNYLTFCRTRRRPVLTGQIEGHYTVAFRSYETSYGL